MRPEQVRIGREPPAADLGNGVAGAIIDIGYLGDVSLYKLRIRDGSLVRARVANVGGVEPAIGVGEQVWLSWPAEAAIVLLPATATHVICEEQSD